MLALRASGTVFVRGVATWKKMIGITMERGEEGATVAIADRGEQEI